MDIRRLAIAYHAGYPTITRFVPDDVGNYFPSGQDAKPHQLLAAQVEANVGTMNR
jgi:hypothetical protein